MSHSVFYHIMSRRAAKYREYDTVSCDLLLQADEPDKRGKLLDIPKFPNFLFQERMETLI